MRGKIIMNNKVESKLYNQVISKQNIYNAIYGLNSYIFEKGLLDKNDLELYYKLQDKYDFETISDVIEECEKKLIQILKDDNSLFDIKVFFKMKKHKDKKVIVILGRRSIRNIAKVLLIPIIYVKKQVSLNMRCV